MDNDYVKTLFKKSTLNTDSILKNVKPSKPFHHEKGKEILDKIEQSIPLNYYPEVAPFITLYNKGVNLHFLNYMINYYQHDIKQELKKQGLPEELSFLPAILSGFNPLSTNTTGGVGYWHLNYPQAIKYGLRINEYVDERFDLEKSTIAAAKYLKQLHLLYNDWELTLAAYTCGPSSINNLQQRKKVITYTDLYPFLNPNSRDIVPALTAYIYTYAKNSSNQIKINPLIEADTFYVESKLSFRAILDVININKKELLFLNPSVINEVFPANYLALLPKNTGFKMHQYCDSIYFYQDSVLNKPIVEIEETTIELDKEEIKHKVKSGDVLGVIAQKYGVRISDIQDWNNLKGTRINIGQTLIVYKKKISSKTPQKTTEPEIISSDGNYIMYKVKDGDNLWDIAANFDGVSPDDIMELNNIDENLQIGQVLKIKKK
ncbi:MAG: LysM peptidoglycan-binding domain-containing protein [Flavobacteriales bacterium]|nr:LysM peptidoglycan-binding domain-containing protein [Flavobacteriales bacterium]